MHRKGINYDVGIHPFGEIRPSRPHFDPEVVRREIAIIRRDLHCNAIRIVGRDLDRLTTAAGFALDEGLEVWFSPALHDATEKETLAYFAECAQAAEQLHQRGPVIFIAGWELTFFMKGLVLGDTGTQRIQAFLKPWRLLWSAIRLGPFNQRLNKFLAEAAATVRAHFHGPVTYASGTWEEVDWAPFDFVSIDCYRDARNAALFRGNLTKYFRIGKPVIITEFGCCTYQGAEERGGYGWAIVDWDQQPPRLKGAFTRDETVQAAYLAELLALFAAEEVEGAFPFTFVMPKYPHHSDPALDLDIASYALVKTLPEGAGTAYPGLPWEPKEAFHILAEFYREP